MNEHITPHFTVAEFEKSGVAARRGIDNSLPNCYRDNILRTAKLLEEIRAEVQRVFIGRRYVIITSGYRCPELNDHVGGSDTSQHMMGEAADFVVQNTDVRDVFEMIKDKIDPRKIDQCIMEYGRWIHISTVKEGNRGEFFGVV